MKPAPKNIFTKNDYPLLRGCATKTVFRDLKHAIEVAKQNSTSRVKLRPYKCRFCSAYHLTKNPPRRGEPEIPME